MQYEGLYVFYKRNIWTSMNALYRDHTNPKPTPNPMPTPNPSSKARMLSLSNIQTWLNVSRLSLKVLLHYSDQDSIVKSPICIHHSRAGWEKLIITANPAFTSKQRDQWFHFAHHWNTGLEHLHVSFLLRMSQESSWISAQLPERYMLLVAHLWFMLTKCQHWKAKFSCIILEYVLSYSLLQVMMSIPIPR